MNPAPLLPAGEGTNGVRYRDGRRLGAIGG